MFWGWVLEDSCEKIEINKGEMNFPSLYYKEPHNKLRKSLLLRQYSKGNIKSYYLDIIN